MKIPNFTSCKIIWGVKEITNLRNLGFYILEPLPLPLWVWPLPRPLDCTSPLGVPLPLEFCLGLAPALDFFISDPDTEDISALTWEGVGPPIEVFETFCMICLSEHSY